MGAGGAGVKGEKSGFLLKNGCECLLRWSEDLGSVLGCFAFCEVFGGTSGVVEVGVATEELEVDSEKRRFRVPPLNIALTSSHAYTIT